MAEPLFMQADIKISASALRRWLKSSLLPAVAFEGWPESVLRSNFEISRVAVPTQPRVTDELIACCVDSFGLGDGHLYCHYDEQAKALHFAVCFPYGDEAGVMETAIFLCALLRGIAEIYTAKTEVSEIPCSRRG